MKDRLKSKKIIIIIGVVILIILAILLIKPKQGEVDPKIKPIYDSINNCIEQRSIDAIYLIGLGGGYVENTFYVYEETNIGTVAYGLKNNKNLLISKKDLEKEIEEYVEDSINFCFFDGEFSEYDITLGNPKVNVNIKNDKVIINTAYKIEIIKGNKNYKIRYFSNEIPIRLGRILDVANQIVKEQIKTNEIVSLEEIDDLNFIYDYYGDDVILYIINDENSKIDDISYSFMFLGELDSSEVLE